MNYVAIHENDRISPHCEMKIMNGINIVNESANSFVKSIHNVNRFEWGYITIYYYLKVLSTIHISKRILYSSSVFI